MKICARSVVFAAGVSALLAASGGARAAIVDDFEGTYSGTGSVIVDPEDAGNHVLFLNNTQIANFVTSGTTGTVTMRIYDFGVDTATSTATTVYGPRWGVSDSTSNTANSAGATIINRGSIPSTSGYGMEGTNTPMTKTGSWFSPQYFAGPRQVDALDDPSTTDNEGDGKWSTWTFLVNPDGTVKMSVTGIGTTKTSGVVSGTMLVTDMHTIWIYGGSNPPAGVYNLGVLVDDITFTAADPVPEPASLSILGLSGALLLPRRRGRTPR
jgi:hypothetical protein